MKIPEIATISLFISALLVSLGGNLTAATANELLATEPARLRLVSAVEGTEGRDTLRVGLHIQLAPGWKTYWRSPGDAGIPPTFDWSGSRNLEQATVLWPRPEYFESYGIGSWGYRDEVVFPIDVRLAEKGAPLEIKLRLHLGLCENICIPYERDLTLSLAATTAEASAEAALIAAFVRRVPQEAGAIDAIAETMSAEATAESEFILTVKSAKALHAPEVIVEGKSGSYFDVISRNILPSGKEARFLVAADLPSKADRLAGQDIMVTVMDGDLAAQKKMRIE